MPIEIDSGDSGASSAGSGSVTITGPSFKLSGPTTVKPPYVEKIDVEISGKSETLTDQCGYTEVRKNGTGNWTVTANGIISARELSAMRTIGDAPKQIRVTSEPFTGMGVCDSMNITQKDDLTGISFPGKGYSGNESAFQFQVQIRQSASNQGGGVIPNFS